LLRRVSSQESDIFLTDARCKSWKSVDNIAGNEHFKLSYTAIRSSKVSAGSAAPEHLPRPQGGCSNASV
jgi:hypothetical protein